MYLSGGCDGWNQPEETPAQVWESCLQKPGNENKVSRYAWKVRLSVLRKMFIYNVLCVTMFLICH